MTQRDPGLLESWTQRAQDLHNSSKVNTSFRAIQRSYYCHGFKIQPKAWCSYTFFAHSFSGSRN